MRDDTISGENVTSDNQGAPDYIDLETPTRRGDVAAATLCLAAGLIGYFVLVPIIWPVRIPPPASHAMLSRGQ